MCYFISVRVFQNKALKRMFGPKRYLFLLFN
jgi:hypothetical protein